MPNIPEIRLAPETLWQIGPFNISNSLFTTFILTLLLIFFAFMVRKKAGIRPSRLQVVFEMIMEYMLEKTTLAFGSEKRARKYFPVLFTIFLFLLFANQLTLIPFFESIFLGDFTLFRLPTAHYALPITFAVLCLVSAHIIAIFTSPIGYLSHFIKIKPFLKVRSFADFGMAFIEFFLGLMEIVGELAKFISISTRLFGNIFAGGVIVAIIGGITIFTSFIVPIPFILLGILSGVVQAFVFTTLLTLFMSGLVNAAESHGAHGHETEQTT